MVEDCEQRATLAAQVARDSCRLNGGFDEECQVVYMETYNAVYEECNG